MRRSLMRLGREGVNPTMLQDTTVEDHLDLLIDLQNYLGKALAPYEEFVLGGKTYYLNRAGFLHRKDSGSEEVRAPSAATSTMRCGTT